MEDFILLTPNRIIRILTPLDTTIVDEELSDEKTFNIPLVKDSVKFFFVLFIQDDPPYT